MLAGRERFGKLDEPVQRVPYTHRRLSGSVVFFFPSSSRVGQILASETLQQAGVQNFFLRDFNMQNLI